MRIHSIFQSVNGEVCKMHQGSVCAFIRTQGCNLNCSWCDTRGSLDPSKGEEISVRDIIQAVKDLRVDTRNITITGGEPLLQKEMPHLVQELYARKYDVSIETNGTLSAKPYIDIVSFNGAKGGLCSIVMDIKPISAFDGGGVGGSYKYRPYYERAIKNCSELSDRDWVKFPVQDMLDFSEALAAYSELRDRGCNSGMAFSAVSPLSPKEVLEWLHTKNIGDAVLNVQLHKLIGVA